jgi:exodeoxyribonuclease VII large subunit
LDLFGSPAKPDGPPPSPVEKPPANPPSDGARPPPSVPAPASAVPPETQRPDSAWPPASAGPVSAPVASAPEPPQASAVAPNPPKSDEPPVLSVAELGHRVRRALDGDFTEPVFVEGEVCNTKSASSGHLYFALKDDKADAVIDLVMYKTSVTLRTRQLVKDGARVRLRGRPTYWVPRGRLQFVADRAQAAGKGALLEALEALKKKLAAEGLFAADRKKPLPKNARTVGVVTSPNGAAIHDVCRVAFRRGRVNILLSPALVQGAGAAESIRRALLVLSRVQGLDVIIVGRGGGSSDDLSAFNDEELVRAIAACPVPVVSAVGHEVDVTLTDFVADARAATPSQAAEMVVADDVARREAISLAQIRLSRAMRGLVVQAKGELAHLDRRLGDPRLALASFEQSIDDRWMRLARFAENDLASKRNTLARLDKRLALRHPVHVIAGERQALAQATTSLEGAMRRTMERRSANLTRAFATLDAMSPLKVLSRGYAIATTKDGKAVRSGRDVVVGDALDVRVSDGTIAVRVLGVEGKEK